MAKNIEVTINDEAYEILKSESILHKLDMQRYVSMMIEESSGKKRIDRNYIEEKIRKPLEKILVDLDEIELNTIKKDIKDKIMIIPLNLYKKKLPEELDKIILYYNQQSLYDTDHFYLILDGANIVGYVGMTINEEDAPYGKYVYIFGFYLYKEYQNHRNTKYIMGFIQSVGRKNQCYSIDVVLEGSNLGFEHFREMGFDGLNSTDIIQIDGLKNKQIDLNLFRIEKCMLEDVQNFLPVARTEPTNFMLKRWESKKEAIEIYSILNKDEKRIAMYVKEDKNIHTAQYNFITLLVEKEHLYDDPYIEKILFILKGLLSKGLPENEKMVVAICKYMNKNQSLYKEKDILDSINWLRKNNS